MLIVLMVSGRLLSQEKFHPLVTDRPDQTESSRTVPAGMLQIEAGMVQEWDQRPEDVMTRDIRSLSGSMLLRYGLLERFELRLGNGYLKQDFEGGGFNRTVDGFEPVTAGIKYWITDETGWIPEAAIITSITLSDFGEETIRPRNTALSTVVAMSHSLGTAVSAGISAGYLFDGSTPDGTGYYSAVLGVSALKNTGLFAEAYGYLDKGKIPVHLADGGITYQIRPNLQLDLSAGFGITDNAPKAFLGGGVSWRVPR